MAGIFPANLLRWGYSHSLQIKVGVTTFRSGKEQRHVTSGLLNSFTLPFGNVPWPLTTTLREFFISQKGSYDSTWSLAAVDPKTKLTRSYAALAFDSDEFTYNEQRIGRYALSFDVKQTVAEAVVLNVQSDYPLINGGVRVQLPFQTSLGYRTERNDLEYGKRISRYVWPSALRRWKLEYGAITDTELQTLVNFYLGQGGPLKEFYFTDPNTDSPYGSCRFAEAPLQIVRVGLNVNKLTAGIDQFLAP